MKTTRILVALGATVFLTSAVSSFAASDFTPSSFAASDTDADAKMREALRAKMEELNEPGAPTPTPAPAPGAPKTETVVVPVPAEAPVASAQSNASSGGGIYSEVPDADTDAKNAQLLEALRQQKRPMAVQPAVADSGAGASSPGSILANLPEVAPPVSQSKEAQLAALLSRYKADLITPQEYHKERAAILAK